VPELTSRNAVSNGCHASPDKIAAVWRGALTTACGAKGSVSRNDSRSILRRTWEHAWERACVRSWSLWPVAGAAVKGLGPLQKTAGLQRRRRTGVHSSAHPKQQATHRNSYIPPTECGTAHSCDSHDACLAQCGEHHYFQRAGRSSSTQTHSRQKEKALQDSRIHCSEEISTLQLGAYDGTQTPV